jgi:hypothetical protein
MLKITVKIIGPPENHIVDFEGILVWLHRKHPRKTEEDAEGITASS